MSDLFFSVKTIGLSTNGGRKPVSLLAAAQHNLRTTQAALGACKYIDATKMHENIILQGNDTPERIQEHADKLLQSLNLPKKPRKDYVQALEVVFSLPPDSPIDFKKHFDDCIKWLEAAMQLPVLSAIIHLDESAPHCHILLSPIKDRTYLGGKPVCKESLAKLRDSFNREVAGRSGLPYSGAKLRGQSRNSAIQWIVTDCIEKGFPEMLGRHYWPALRTAIQKDPTPIFISLGEPPLELPQPKPIGLPISTEQPYRFPKKEAEKQTLSCVGFQNYAELEVTAANMNGNAIHVEQHDELERVTDDYVQHMPDYD